jgi:hypothetical protein
MYLDVTLTFKAANCNPWARAFVEENLVSFDKLGYHTHTAKLDAGGLAELENRLASLGLIRWIITSDQWPEGSYYYRDALRCYAQSEQISAELARFCPLTIANPVESCFLEGSDDQRVYESLDEWCSCAGGYVGLGSVGERLMINHSYKNKLEELGLNLRFAPVNFHDPWNVYTYIDPDILNDPAVVPHPYYFVLPTTRLPLALNRGVGNDYDDPDLARFGEIHYRRSDLAMVGPFDLAVAAERVRSPGGGTSVVYVTSARLRGALEELGVFRDVSYFNRSLMHMPCVLEGDS